MWRGKKALRGTGMSVRCTKCGTVSGDAAALVGGAASVSAIEAGTEYVSECGPRAAVPVPGSDARREHVPVVVGIPSFAAVDSAAPVDVVAADGSGVGGPAAVPAHSPPDIGPSPVAMPALQHPLLQEYHFHPLQQKFSPPRQPPIPMAIPSQIPLTPLLPLTRAQTMYLSPDLRKAMSRFHVHANVHVASAVNVQGDLCAAHVANVCVMYVYGSADLVLRVATCSKSE